MEIIQTLHKLKITLVLKWLFYASQELGFTD